MKQLANLVSFDPVGKIVVFQATKFFHAPSLETLLLVVNTTRNEIIYNLADPELGAEDFGVTVTPSGSVYTLNLKAPCTGHASTDSISIFYDDKIDTNDWVQGPDIPVVRTILYANDSGGIDSNGQIVSSNNPLPVSGVVTANVTFPTSQAVTGPLTDTQLRASSLGIRGFSSSLVSLGGTASLSSQEVLSSSTTRRYLFLQNISTAPLHVNFGSAASTSTPRLDSGASFVFEGTFVPQNSIHLIATQGGQNYCILYFNQ